MPHASCLLSLLRQLALPAGLPSSAPLPGSCSARDGKELVLLRVGPKRPCSYKILEGAPVGCRASKLPLPEPGSFLPRSLTSRFHQLRTDHQTAACALRTDVQFHWATGGCTAAVKRYQGNLSEGRQRDMVQHVHTAQPACPPLTQPLLPEPAPEHCRLVMTLSAHRCRSCSLPPQPEAQHFG